MIPLYELAKPYKFWKLKTRRQIAIARLVILALGPIIWAAFIAVVWWLV